MKPSRRARLSIRVRLALALAIALTPILLLGALQTFDSYRHDAAEHQRELVMAAQRSAAGAKARVQGAVGLLETLTPQNLGVDCSQRLGEALSRSPGFVNLARLNAAGRVQCAAGAVPDNPKRGESDWFQRLRAGDALVFAKSDRSPTPSLIAAVRVNDEAGRFAGAQVAVIPLASLRPDLSDPTLPAGTEVALANGEGRLLLQTNPHAFSPPPAGWTTQVATQGASVYRGRDGTGAWRTHVGAPLLDRSVFVILSAPAPSVLSWAQLNPVASLVLPLLAFFVAWGVVWVVADRVIVRWLAYLDRIAALYAKGRFSVRAVHADNAPAEIRALAHTMDGMADAIVARDQSLRDSLGQKDALMREIHHRVKNNLQVITSLLNMQQRNLADPAARAALSDTRQRITALALIYRALYQSPDLRRVDVRQFLEELLAQLMSGEGGRPSSVQTELDADDLEIDPDKLAPLALFTVEAITNARKHAFDDEGGTVHVSFRVTAEEVVLEIADNGRGASDLSASGVGRTLMTAFARQLRGSAEIGPGAQRGTVARLVFPTPEPPPPQPASAEFANLNDPGSGNQAAA